MRNLLPFIIGFVIFGNVTFLSAQGALYEGIERIGLSSGVSIYIIKDEIISPVIYKGATVPIGIHYDRSNQKSVFHTGLFFDKTLLKSSVTEERNFTGTLQKHFSDYWSLTLQTRYLRKVYRSEKFRFLIGGTFQALGVYRVHTISKQLPWDIGYGFLNFQGTLMAQKTFFDKHWLDISLAYGLLSFTMGNQFGRVFTGSEWRWAGKFANYQSVIAYHIPWTAKLTAGLEYRFNYQEYDKDLPYQLAGHQILVVLNYGL